MKKITTYCAYLIYRAMSILVKMIPAKHGTKHLVLIKTDEIGDYILFRTLFRYFRDSSKYQGYKITLIGSDSWKSLYEVYDGGIFDDVIWLNKKRFFKDLAYRFRLLIHTRKLAASDVINCIFSRSTDLDDALAFVTTGREKTAMKCNNSNRLTRQANQNSFVYSFVIDAGDQTIFDYLAILAITDIPISIDLRVSTYQKFVPKDYYVLFIGAGNPERRWPTTYFVDTAQYISSKSKLTPVICGGPPDKAEAENFTRTYSGQALDYAGKTTLPEMIEIIHGAKFIVCVDTGALHIAAAVGCPVVGLFSGKFYGRFAPYPTEISSDFFPIYPDFADKMIARNDVVLYDTFTMKNDTIKYIPPEKIQPILDKMLIKY